MTRITPRGPNAGATPPVRLGELVLAYGHRVDLAAGAVLFREGDPSACVYACVNGRVRLTIATPGGTDLLLGIKMPCQAFGELSAIDGRGRSATATAMERCRVAVLSREQFLIALDGSPSLAVGVLRELSEHLRLANLRTSSRSGDTTAVRVAHRLVELAAQFTRHGPPDAMVVLPITQADLAAWVGATRESTARALAEFRRAGYVSTGRGSITVVDASALAGAVVNR